MNGVIERDISTKREMCRDRDRQRKTESYVYGLRCGGRETNMSAHLFLTESHVSASFDLFIPTVVRESGTETERPSCHTENM